MLSLRFRRLFAACLGLLLLSGTTACAAGTGPATSAPATSAPITTAPITSAPITTAPVPDPPTPEVRRLKIACLGDSLTNLGRGQRTYADFLGDDELILTVQNVGLSGSSMGIPEASGANPALSQRWSQIASDTDVILVFGGANDYGHSRYQVPLGDPAADTTDRHDFCGAVRYLIEKLRDKYPNAVVVFATQLPRDNNRWYETIEGSPANAFDENSFGFREADYADAVLSICARYHVPVIDSFRFATLNGADPAINQRYFRDGLHLNDEGAQILASYFTDAIKAILAENKA